MDLRDRLTAAGAGLHRRDPLVDRRGYVNETPPDYLRPKISDRGLAYMPPIPATHGGPAAGHVSVWTSSAAAELYLWLEVVQPVDRNRPEDGRTIQACVHVRSQDMWHLAQQIKALIRHQNGGALPDWAVDDDG